MSTTAGSTTSSNAASAESAPARPGTGINAGGSGTPSDIVPMPQNPDLFRLLFSFSSNFNPETSPYEDFPFDDDPASLFNSKIVIFVLDLDCLRLECPPVVVLSTQHFKDTIDGLRATKKRLVPIVVVEDISEALIEIVGHMLDIPRGVFLRHQKVRKDLRKDMLQAPIIPPASNLHGATSTSNTKNCHGSTNHWDWYRLVEEDRDGCEMERRGYQRRLNARADFFDEVLGQRMDTMHRYTYAYHEISEPALSRSTHPRHTQDIGQRDCVFRSHIYRPYHPVTTVHTTYPGQTDTDGWWGCAAEERVTVHGFNLKKGEQDHQNDGDLEGQLLLVDGERYHCYREKSQTGTRVRKAVTFRRRLDNAFDIGSLSTFPGPLKEGWYEWLGVFEGQMSSEPKLLNIFLQMELLKSIARNWEVLLATINGELSTFEKALSLDSKSYSDRLPYYDANFSHDFSSQTRQVNIWRYGLAQYHREVTAQLLDLQALLAKCTSTQLPQTQADRSDSVEKSLPSYTTTKIRFEQIFQDIAMLQERNERMAQAIMATMSILESKNAISQTEAVTRLTELAFIFIPLSFVSSYFGMSVQDWEADLKKPKLWTFWTVSLILLLAVYLLRLGARSQIVFRFVQYTEKDMRYRLAIPEGQDLAFRNVAYYFFWAVPKELWEMCYYRSRHRILGWIASFKASLLRRKMKP